MALVQWCSIALASLFVVVIAQHHDSSEVIDKIRLVNGASPRMGRLEVSVNGNWATIYDDGDFGEREAIVACRQLGYPTSSAEVFPGGSFGRGSYSMWLYNVDCHGGETGLDDCRYSVCAAGQCSLDLEIGISCDRDTDQYGSSAGYRRWTGLVVLLIIIPFFGHAYRRRGKYGYQDRSLIPIPRYHHGRVPFPSAIEDTGISASFPGGLQAYPQSGPGIPPEPLPPVYTNGYVYPPSGSLLPQPTSTVVQNMSPRSGETTEGLAHHPAVTATPDSGLNTAGSESVNGGINSEPPEYSEFDVHGMTPAATEHTRYESSPIMGSPPPYEDIVKT